MCATEGARLLIVDDDAQCAHVLASVAREDGYEVAVADGGGAALTLFEQFAPDAVVTELKLPELDGNELVKALHRRDPGLPVILLSDALEVCTAVAAMQAGAADVIAKPASWSQLRAVLVHELERRALLADAVARDSELRERLGLGLQGLVGTSPAMREVFTQARQVAAGRTTVLITGESGTGKGELARAIHALSPRAAGPFVALHCASFSAALVESELFGHERGAFTGADRRYLGRFERAKGGTLFIDEVSEIPPGTQTKLLRVLQERRFERVGGDETELADVRLVAATNRDLHERVLQGRFREDLYYRLNIVAIQMPPLRARQDDLLLLGAYFLAQSASANGKIVTGFTDAARDKLLGHTWPGNARELQNAIERGVVMTRASQVDAKDLPDLSAPSDVIGIPGATLHEIELHAVRTTFKATGESTKRTAEVLGMSQRTVQYRLRELGLARPRGRPSKT